MAARHARLVVLAVVLLVVAACGDSATTTTTANAPPVTAPPTTVPPTTVPPTTVPPTPVPPTTAPPTTVAPTTVAPTTVPPTTVAPTTTLPPEAIVIGEPDGAGVIEVMIDGGQLAPLFDAFTPGADPFYLVHTQQEDIFVGVELYTVFGDSWTGQLGTFPADCTTHGICVYLDPDGTGPLEGGGPGTGTITIVGLEGGSIVILDDITIVGGGGQVYTLSGVTLTG